MCIAFLTWVYLSYSSWRSLARVGLGNDSAFSPESTAQWMSVLGSAAFLTADFVKYGIKYNFFGLAGNNAFVMRYLVSHRYWWIICIHILFIYIYTNDCYISEFQNLYVLKLAGTYWLAITAQALATAAF